jgi:hypothetical protein
MLYTNVQKLIQEVPTTSGAKDVLIPKWLFDQLLHCALTNARFDEEWYLKTYPDVAAAVQARKIRTGREHFVTTGYFEGRFPYDIKVDESFYLRKNEDVNRAVRARKIKSAKEHWTSTGINEGRQPSEDFSLFSR